MASVRTRGASAPHPLVVAVALALLAVAPTSAQITLTEVNPDKSDLDMKDPNGASGGRVNGLAAVAGDNQVYYAATEWGGLYKSTDAGVTWTFLEGHLPMVTWGVEVDPVTTSRVYATSFYDGRMAPVSGIEVSNDAGLTWSHPLTAHPDPTLEGTPNDNTPDPAFACTMERRTEPSAFGIGIRPDAPANVFVGTNCGVAISNDSGVTWHFVDPTPGVSNCSDGSDACDVWDVVVQAGGADGIIDICGDDGHQHSTDGGVTWTPGAGLPGGRCSIAASPDEAYVLYAVAADNFVYETVDGVNWASLGQRNQQGRIPFVRTNQRSDDPGPVDRFDVWYGDVDLFRGDCTTPAAPAPGGATRCPALGTWAGPFSKAAGAHNDAGDIVFDTTVAVDACPRLHSNDGGVYRNTDTGADCQNPDWEQPNKTPHATWLFAMAGAQKAGDATEDLHFGVQDDGSWTSSDAGATPPAWSNKDCCDVFDIAADSSRVLHTVCCFTPGPSNRLFLTSPGLQAGVPTGGGGANEINTYPGGTLPGFRPIGVVERFADKQYVVVTTSGVFLTKDITASPIVWTQLGPATSPANACGVEVSVDAGTGVPTFYVQAGGPAKPFNQSSSCNERNMGNSGDELWAFTDVDPTGTWTRIDNNGGQTGGIGVFAADPTNPQRLYASNTRAVVDGGPRMVFSNDGGLTWSNDAALDGLMTGGGVFKYRTERGAGNFTPRFIGYPQPTLLAIDPEDPNVMVAGGRDSGVFLSLNGGATWTLVTDPFTPNVTGIPHLPRPWFAYFDHEPAGEIQIYIGTQGRGVWRISGVLAPVNRFFCSYFVFAARWARLKDMMLDNLCNIGVDCGSPADPADPCGSLVMEGAQFAGSQVVADRVTFAKQGATISQLFRNNPGPLAGITLLNPPELPFVPEIIPGTCGPDCTPDLPALEALCGFPVPFPGCDPSKRVIVRAGQDCPPYDSTPGNNRCDLPPGAYGAVNVRSDGHLVLAPGDYTFCSYLGGRRARLEASGSTVNIAGGRFRTGNNSMTGEKCGDLTVRVKGTRTVSLGRNATIAAKLCAPAARLGLGHHNMLIGKFFGDRVFSDRDNMGHGCCGLP